jgi:iron complex transport system ATP-binding protein
LTNDVSNGADQDERPAAFETRNLSFAIGERLLVHPLHLRFPAGEVSALVGHNGSGKTTLLKLLARQAAPSDGTILFENQPLETWQRRAFARAVAYLPQDTPAALGMTVGELVACGRYPWHGALGAFRDADRDKVSEAMQLTDTVPLADRMLHTLSGGERQRAWIAMLVAQDSRCLLLDEPTSALDIAHQIEILSLVRSLSHDRNLSVVLVMHDINLAARFCDHIHALKDGRLVADGRPDDFMTAATLETVYGIAMGVTAHPTLGSPLAYVL